MSVRPLWKHQEEGIKRGLQQNNYLYAFEQGTGKTRTMIETLRRLYARHDRVLRTLIVCPIIVCDNWKNEFALYSKVDPKDIVVLTKSGKHRVGTLLRTCGADLTYNKILITNYQGLLIEDFAALMLAYAPEVVIFDESQRVKNPTSKTAKRAALFGDKADYCYLLTGTPILNSPMDIFQQFRVMDKGATFGKNYMTFKLRYFKDENAAFKSKQSYFPKWVVQPQYLPELMAKIETKSMRVLKSECMDLPPLVKQKIFVELSSQQEKMYEEMRKEFITFLNTSTGPRAVVAELAITKAMRMQQIVTGFARDEDGTDHPLENPRITVLKELLEDLTPHHKVIVWACFHRNYEDIRKVCDQLGIKYVELHGEVAHQKRIDNMNEFRSNPDVRVVIANQRAAGLGINLVEASYAIYYSKNHSLEDQLQSEARNHRGGSEMHEKVTQIDLVARGTVDELINDALERKLKVAEYIIDNKGSL